MDVWNEKCHNASRYKFDEKITRIFLQIRHDKNWLYSPTFLDQLKPVCWLIEIFWDMEKYLDKNYNQLPIKIAPDK